MKKAFLTFIEVLFILTFCTPAMSGYISKVDSKGNIEIFKEIKIAELQPLSDGVVIGENISLEMLVGLHDGIIKKQELTIVEKKVITKIFLPTRTTTTIDAVLSLENGDWKLEKGQLIESHKTDIVSLSILVFTGIFLLIIGAKNVFGQFTKSYSLFIFYVFLLFGVYLSMGCALMFGTLVGFISGVVFGSLMAVFSGEAVSEGSFGRRMNIIGGLFVCGFSRSFIGASFNLANEYVILIIAVMFSFWLLPFLIKKFFFNKSKELVDV
ncbi:hypothetical protein K8R32_02375 [bacterium]|nr:hypothetical protein [bacterium]